MSALPDSRDEMLRLLETLDDTALQEMFEAQAELERRLREHGPQDDEELHEWLKHELRIDIPRTSVCDGHDPPFKFLADLFFERCDAALLMANRGGSKTFLVAVLHWLNSRFKPGVESCTFGATEAQSLRAYAHLKSWIYDEDATRKSGKAVLRPEIASSLMRETIFRNGSKVEVLPGTAAAVNGPHPQKAHADEIELMDDGTWRESRNMTISKRLKDGRVVKPQDIATSTRKGPNGRMQLLIDEIEQAVIAGYRPPRTLYVWCIKETAAQVVNCQVACPELPPGSRCECEHIRKGEWEDGTARLLKDICGGDFHRSRGWQPYPDLVKQFTENDRDTFEVQQLCAKPEMRHHYVPMWNDDRHLIRGFEPDPEHGPIFLSVDWGGTNPHAVNWYQLLKFEIEVDCWRPLPGQPSRLRLKEGSLVVFDEIYVSEIGNDRLGDLVIRKEREYQKRYGRNWRVFERYADPAGKAARQDWKAKGLKCSWRATREFDEHIKLVRDWFDEDALFVVGERCPMFRREIKEWRADPQTGKQVDSFNHCVAGDTLVQTRKGLRRAEILAGTTVEVLTQGGRYRRAAWKSYGERDVYEVEFADGEVIRATDGHQWIVQRNGKGRDGTGTERVTTLDLVGRRVPTQAARWKIRDQEIYAQGVQHGLVYGDGTVGTTNGHSYAWVKGYGEENVAVLKAAFAGRHGEQRSSSHLGVTVATKMLDPALKRLPRVQDPDYRRGFLAGLIAADGAVNRQGCCYIASSKAEDIEVLVMLCQSVGIVVAKVEQRAPGAGVYPNAKPQYRIWLTKGSLDETLLLKPTHRVNGLHKTRWAKSHNIEVVAVRSAGRAEVFCCEEPVTNSFVLADGKLTSNCMSNFRYMLANLKKIHGRMLGRAETLPAARAIRRNALPAIRISRAASGPIGFRNRKKDDEFANWRKNLGGPNLPDGPEGYR